MQLIIGLGNPGQEYAHTRHNIGWDAVAAWAEARAWKFQSKSRFQAEVAEGSIEGEKIILARPLTYMNLSGQAARAVFDFYKLAESDLLIVHDDMDYPLGKLAFCAQGGAAGHNGVSSIHDSLGTNRVQRLRLGIGRPADPIPAEDYVLQKFSSSEQKVVANVLAQAQAAMTDWSRVGIEKAMNIWNARASS